jgi:preprotein translocase subunit YajC
VDAVGALFPFVLILAAFYLLIIRPARTRQKAAQQLQSELAPGQSVMTTSGVFATISAVEDDAVLLQVSPGVNMRFAKPAIARIIPPEESATGTQVSPGDDERPGGGQPV